MAAKRKTDGSKKPVDVHKLHIDYNLEKEPLRTGETAPRTTWRERAVMGLGGWGYRSLVIVFWIVLILIVGYAVASFVTGAFPPAYTTP